MAPQFGTRSYQSGDVHVLVLSGDIDIDAAAEINAKLARLQRASTVFVDLWDTTSIDSACLEVLLAAKRRAEKTHWDFAVIAEPGGVAAQEIEAAGLGEELHPAPTKRDALQELRFSGG